MSKHLSSINAIDTMNTESRGRVQITIQSLRNDFRKNLLCLTIPTISDAIPAETFLRDSIKIPANIKLADPEFHLPRAVDLLIGAGTTLSLLSVGQINLTQGEHDLYLQKAFRLGRRRRHIGTKRNRKRVSLVKSRLPDEQVLGDRRNLFRQTEIKGRDRVRIILCKNHGARCRWAIYGPITVSRDGVNASTTRGQWHSDD